MTGSFDDELAVFLKIIQYKICRGVCSMLRKSKALSLLLILVSLLTFVQVSTAVAKTFHVDQRHPASSDSNSGSKAQPWASLHPTTQKEFSPGDVIVVHPGVYTPGSGSESKALIDPRSSGRSKKPITFISRPRHAAVLEGQAGSLAIINISAQNYIVIDGFNITDPGTAGIVVKGKIQKPLYGITIKNNLISRVRNKFAANNTDGIRLFNVAQSKIMNNKITDIKDGASTANAAAIKLYNVDRINIQNNDMTNVTSGVYIRKNGSNVRIRHNFISNTEFAVKVSNSNMARLRHIDIEYNIFKGTELAIQLMPEGGTVDKVSINNNIFLNYSVAALQVTQPGMGKIKIWNNIFDRGDISTEFIADIFTYDDPPISLSKMDYNLFATKPVFINGLYNTNRRLSGLGSWQQYSELDQYSMVASPNFKSAKNNNFRLKEHSVAVNGGRKDGSPSDKKVNIGAYESSKTVIGYRRSEKKKKSTQVATKSTVRTNKSVSKQGKSKKTKVPNSNPKKQLATNKKPSTVASKSHSKSTRPATKSVAVSEANNAKTKSAKTPNSTSNTASKEPIVVASIYPDAKPRKKQGLTKLEWDVRNALKYDGACVLESNKVYFYDGHDNTGLKLRLLNGGLYLVTKSNIDISFKDIGIKVGKNALVHADRVVDDQTVLIEKQLPQLLSQLDKNDEAKIQLRFWPTYPATQTYSENIRLSGFKEAYQEYKSCKKGN